MVKGYFEKRTPQFTLVDWDLIIKLVSDEKERIKFALKQTKSRGEAYKMLKMTERTFYRKMRKYNLPYKGKRK